MKQPWKHQRYTPQKISPFNQMTMSHSINTMASTLAWYPSIFFVTSYHFSDVKIKPDLIKEEKTLAKKL